MGFPIFPILVRRHLHIESGPSKFFFFFKIPLVDCITAHNDGIFKNMSCLRGVLRNKYLGPRSSCCLCSTTAICLPLFTLLVKYVVLTSYIFSVCKPGIHLLYANMSKCVWSQSQMWSQTWKILCHIAWPTSSSNGHDIHCWCFCCQRDSTWHIRNVRLLNRS